MKRLEGDRNGENRSNIWKGCVEDCKTCEDRVGHRDGKDTK
jgi:hypothetical protein